MRRAALPLVAALWLGCMPAAARAADPAYALVVGHNAPPAGDQELRSLRFADDDAVRFHQLFKRAGAQSTLLTSLDASTRRRYPRLARHARPPTKLAVQRALDALAARVALDVKDGLEPTVFVSYSGHGAFDREAGPGLSLQDGILPRAALREALSAFAPTRVHLFVDACYAGAIVGSRGPFEREIEGERVTLSEADLAEAWGESAMRPLPHVGVVLASSAVRRTHEWSRIEAGVFTHEIVSGLLGAADVNGDLRVEYSELYAFITAANRGVRDPRAHLDVVVRPPGGDHTTVLLSLQRFTDVRWLHGRVADPGHLYVELDNGQRLLDAHPVADERIALALPAGQEAYVVMGGREAIVRGNVEAVRFERLNFGERSRRDRGAIQTALRNGWFESSFGTAYYLGFVDSRDIEGAVFDAPAVLPTPPDEGLARPQRISAWTLACAGLAAAGTTLAIALKARRDFQGNDLEARAYELDRRYRHYGYAAMGSAAVAAAGAAWSIRLEIQRKRKAKLTAGLTGLRGSIQW